MTIRDRDRLYAVGVVAVLVVLGLLSLVWFASNVLGLQICPCG